MRARALAVLGLILGGSAAAEPLDWFASSWCYDAGGTRFEEHWTGEAGEMLIGMAETVAGDRITGFEYMRIERRGGTELYVGHPPRQLDRNITLAGRVLQGMDWLASLPRGHEALGFRADRATPVPIRRVRVAADVPVAERSAMEVLRTDRPTFEARIESRRNRRDERYQFPAGYIDLCHVPVPVRPLN
jgi:hypothetical protein